MGSRRARDPRPKFEKPKGIKSRAEIRDPEAEYHRLTYSSPNDLSKVTAVEPWHRYDEPGDHFYVEEINGPDSLIARFGSFSSDPVQLWPGRTIRRKFRVFWVTSIGLTPADSVGVARWGTEATFYVSTGPLIVEPGRIGSGFERGFLARRGCVATTNARSVFQDLYDSGAIAPAVPLGFGRRGGTLLIRNADPSNVLQVFYQLEGAIMTAARKDTWELYPGEVMRVPMDGPIAGFKRTLLALGDFREGVMVGCDVGTCLYNWTVTANRTDTSDGRSYDVGKGY